MAQTMQFISSQATCRSVYSGLRQVEAASSGNGPAGVPFGSSRKTTWRREQVSRTVRCAAPKKVSAPEAAQPAVTTPASKADSIGTFGDLMAFSGPAPEVINGRLAMWGFAAAAISELTEGRTIGEQFLSSPAGPISFALFVTLGSFIPIFISEVSLGELLDTATESGMPPQLKYANASVEKWTGRVAMLAFLIFILIEAFAGKATFSVLKGLVGL